MNDTDRTDAHFLSIAELGNGNVGRFLGTDRNRGKRWSWDERRRG